MREGRLLFAVHGHSGAVAQAAFSPDAEQTLFASAGKDDQLVKVWRSNLGCYTHKAATGGGNQERRARPVSAPPLPLPLQRVYHYNEELPGPQRLPRPAYQRPTPPSPPPYTAQPPQVEGQPVKESEWGGASRGGSGGSDVDAPTAAQTMKGRTGRGWEGEGGQAAEEERWRSSSLRGGQRQRQEGGLDVDGEDEGQGGWGKAPESGGVGVMMDTVRLVPPSAPPLEPQAEDEDEELAPRRTRPPRPDSAGAAATAPMGATGGSSSARPVSSQQLQQTLQAMTQTMQLIAERLALVEDRLPGAATVVVNAAGSCSSGGSASSPTLQLPTPMRAAAAALGGSFRPSETGEGRGRVFE